MEPQGQATGDGEKILVVEDSRTQAEKLHYFLASNGYDVAMAADGVEGLSVALDFKPRVVLSDVMMPNMDGYELCTKLKQDKAHEGMAVILLTSLSSPDDILKGLKCGADSFLVKPYDEEQLLSRLRYVTANLAIRQHQNSQMGVEILFDGQHHFIESHRIQILDLLLSSYEAAVYKNAQLERANEELRGALATISTLKELIPICAACKKIRDDEGYWHQVEKYVTKHTGAEFTHGICPDCAKEHLDE